MAALRAKSAKKKAAEESRIAAGGEPKKEKPKKQMSFMEQLKAKTDARRGA